MKVNKLQQGKKPHIHRLFDANWTVQNSLSLSQIQVKAMPLTTTLLSIQLFFNFEEFLVKKNTKTLFYQLLKMKV